MIDKEIEKMICKLNTETLSWIESDKDGLLRFIDPIDKKEISAHYGATHAAVAWIIYGKKVKDISLVNKGKKLLSSIIVRWKESINEFAYHYDFNNFALCVAYEYLKDDDESLSNEIKEVILNTPDSNNPTINWYPMRWYVNLQRYHWTGRDKYKLVCEKCRKTIRDATFNDGFIDDRIPKGKSFNLQYDISTVAGMQFLRIRGEKIDLSKELGALLNIISPDGDINYLGRGTNQIFAWGPWIYLLISSGSSEVSSAVKYMQSSLPIMLANHNLMLNYWPGEEKYLWWDYHYCSVYTAHLLLWLVLSLEDVNASIIEPKFIEPSDSGLHVQRSENYMVVLFDGRSEYLAERGPSVALIWVRKYGVIVKGCFAPWQGAFGNNYSHADITLRNYCGLISVAQNKDYSHNRYLHKILPNLYAREKESIEPNFFPIEVSVSNHQLSLIWRNNKKEKMMLNVPVLVAAKFSCEVDGKYMPLYRTMKIRNQYDWVELYQTRLFCGYVIKMNLDI